MRSSWRLLTVLTALTLLALVVTPAMVAALPAQARSAFPASVTAVTATACDRAVCESVTGAGFTVHSAKATAHAVRTVCGHFTMTITNPRTRTATNSPPICAGTPSYLFPVRRTFPVGTTIAMQFSNPLTPGRAVVRLPLR
jgi:hypothetical protein